MARSNEGAWSWFSRGGEVQQAILRTDRLVDSEEVSRERRSCGIFDKKIFSVPNFGQFDLDFGSLFHIFPYL